MIQSQVTNNVTDLTDQQTALHGVATNIALAQNALQASADVFQTLQTSSLLNLLCSTSS